MGPEAAELNVGLRNARVLHQEPGTENSLSEDIKNGVGNDLAVDGQAAGAIPKAPNTARKSAIGRVSREVEDVHGIGCPKDNGVAGQHQVEVGNTFRVLSLGLVAAIHKEVPDDHQIGNAGNRVVAPLRGRVVPAERSEQTHEDHDDVRKDGHQEVGTVETGKQAEVDEQEWRGKSPINVAGPEDLALNVGEGVGHMVVGMADGDVLDGHTLSGGHNEVGQGGDGRNECRDDMVETVGL